MSYPIRRDPPCFTSGVPNSKALLNWKGNFSGSFDDFKEKEGAANSLGSSAKLIEHADNSTGTEEEGKHIGSKRNISCALFPQDNEPFLGTVQLLNCLGG